MADKNSAKCGHQDSSPPQCNDNDTLLPTHNLKAVQENNNVTSDTRSLWSLKAGQLKHEKITLHGMVLGPEDDQDAASDHEPKPKEDVVAVTREAIAEDNGRERLKRHRIEVAGRVWIPEIWGQEDLLKDWIDCSVFEASLASSGIMSARAALVNGEGKRTNSNSLRIGNRC